MPSSATPCAQCSKPFLARMGCYWQDRWYCNRQCTHAAGNRSACSGWDCGCTGYSKKRRLLRIHREQMRVMMYFIDRHGLLDAFQDMLLNETDHGWFWRGLGHDDGVGGMDELDDTEDPEQQLRAVVDDLRAEATDQSAMVQAVREALKCLKYRRADDPPSPNGPTLLDDAAT